MISIEELRLQNFQTHKDISLKFSPTFNCIIGPSRTGKSCVIRAIDFLLYNNWFKEYQRFGSEATIITAKLSNGTTVIRTKSDKINKVVLKKGKEVKEFEGFGVTLPREVIEAFGVFPLEVDSDSFNINVAHQDEPQFLLYVTGSTRTKILSKLSGLHWIDYALRDLGRDKKKNTSEIHSLKSSTEDLRKNLSEYEGLDNLRDRIAYETQRLEKVRSLVSYHSITNILSERVTEWKGAFAKLQELKAQNPAAIIPKLENLITTYTDVYLKLKDTTRKFSSNESSLRNINIHLNTLKTSKVETQSVLDKELENNPECPTCGGIIDPVKFRGVAV